jgi:hypothetical protein
MMVQPSGFARLHHLRREVARRDAKGRRARLDVDGALGTRAAISVKRAPNQSTQVPDYRILGFETKPRMLDGPPGTELRKSTRHNLNNTTDACDEHSRRALDQNL